MPDQSQIDAYIAAGADAFTQIYQTLNPPPVSVTPAGTAIGAQFYPTVPAAPAVSISAGGIDLGTVAFVGALALGVWLLVR